MTDTLKTCSLDVNILARQVVTEILNHLIKKSTEKAYFVCYTVILRLKKCNTQNGFFLCDFIPNIVENL